MKTVKTWLPTRKWVATQVTATAALAVAWATAHEWSTTLTISAIGIGSQALIAYLVPNSDTPGGVPTKALGELGFGVADIPGRHAAPEE